MAASRLFDVSQRVNPQTAVFPGDQPFSCGWTLRLEKGASVNLSAVTTSPHVGTHADAFLHYLEGGDGIGEEPLALFHGACRVVDVPRGTPLIEERHLGDFDAARDERVLFRTRDVVDPTEFPAAFTALAPEAAAALGAAGTRLVGLDTPSFDPADSKALLAHQALGEHGVANLENLDLSGVPAGRYELWALPLRWEGLDASPVRAVLRPI